MKITLDKMLADGFSRKFAVFFLNLLNREKESGNFDEEYLEWCHSNGYLAENASVCGITEKNKNMYLTDYDYYKSWPLNDWTRIWINDKLTLKYMLADTQYGNFMPDYYYYCTRDGLRSLCDNPYKDNSISSFFSLLEDKKEFACKPCNGSGAEGFVRIENKDGSFFLNGQKKNKAEISEFVVNNPNYLCTQFIYPHKDLSKINHKIHTLIVIVLNENGCNPTIIGGYLRFGHNAQGESNYLHTNDSMNIYSRVNFDTGEFGKTKAVYVNRIEDLLVHPDSGEELSGFLPNYESIKANVIGIAKWFFGIEFMGFDIGITDDGFKIMEINSHPGLAIPQLFRPYLANVGIRRYFKNKLALIDSLPNEEKLKRNTLLR